MPGILAVLALAASVKAQHGSSPAVQVDQSTRGATLFRAQCAGCHGLDGAGTGAGPALNSGVFRHGDTDEAIVRTISKGVPGTAMPAFSYDATQMPHLVAHIRALSIVRAATDVKGDAKAGAALFAKSCAGCHSPAGAFTAPDLSRVGARLTAAQMRQSILDPHATVHWDYWSISGQTKSGQAIRGIRMNEDTHSIQLRDPSGKLHSVMKADLAKVEIVRTSPMPSFKDKLTDAQVTDLIAFMVKGDR
jgi:putative heme-binding domain-containing protein